MVSTAIRVNNLGKKYDILHKKGNEQDSLVAAFAGGIGKLFRSEKNAGTHEEFWALKDISFEIATGDRIGIIGKNGAGKSTLLKILSRIVTPSTGSVEYEGRMASLLEVGTGFHGDLSGRENIYLNGSILGMSRREIDRKFDEIVDFSGVEQFIDTPVKRYSSGMYVRLAFSVAAHLETEILILDEVLAVGDAEFQKKCIAKMQAVAGQGKTILFVSHNIQSILSVCNRGLFLENGKIAACGDVMEVAARYMGESQEESTGFFTRKQIDRQKDLVLSAELLNSKGERSTVFAQNETVTLKIKTNPELKEKFGVTLKLKNSGMDNIGTGSSWLNSKKGIYYQPGDEVFVDMPLSLLTEDKYVIDIICNDWGKYHVDNFWDTVYFKVVKCKPGNFPMNIDRQKELGNVLFFDFSFS